MSIARRIVANTAIQAAGKAVVLLIGAGSVAITTRYLGTDGYGKLTFALGFVQMLGILADAGLSTYVIREISREPERTATLVRNALALRLLLGVTVVGLAALLGLVLPYDGQVRVAILIAGAPFVFGLVTHSLSAIFQARLKMRPVVIADVIGRLAGFGALVAVVVADAGFYLTVVAAGVTAAVAMLLTMWFARHEVPLRPAADRAVWRTMALGAVPLGAMLVVNEIYFRADTLILSLSRPFGEVGLYTLSYRLFELLSLLPAIVMSSVFPLLSRHLADRRELAGRIVDATADVYLAVFVPLALGGLFLGDDIVRLAGGDDFAAAATPFRLLLFAVGLAALNGLLGYTLIAAGQQRSLLWLSAAALGFNVVLNAALTTTLGVDAAAAIALGSELLILCGGWTLMRRHLHMTPRPRVLRQVAGAAAAMVVVLELLKDQPMGVLLPAGIAVYAGALLVQGGVTWPTLEDDAA